MKIMKMSNKLLVVALLFSICPAVMGQPATSRPSNDITVAVLDFTASDLSAKDLGSTISEALTAFLSGENGFRLVDRTSIDRILKEHELNVTGLVDTDKAVQVGKVVGAKIMIIGKAFQLGQTVFITAKLIGTETTLVDGVLVKGDPTTATDKLVIDLAQKVAQRLRENGGNLVAADRQIDRVSALQKTLAGRKLPVMAVVVPEKHITPVPARPPDPAAETEIRLLLSKCGVTLREVKPEVLAEWTKDKSKPWPSDLDGVDVLVSGEAFSEFAARIGNLVSCNARLEVTVIDRKTGTILLSDRETSRAVDLSENLAGKDALQKAGRSVGVRILEMLDRTMPRP